MKDSTIGSDVVGVVIGAPAVGGVRAVKLVIPKAKATHATVKHARGSTELSSFEVPLRADGSVTIDFSVLEPGDVITVKAV